MENKREKGYIYCISNKLNKIYEEEIYKIGYTRDVNRRKREYDRVYIDKCKIEIILEVENKILYEEYIMYRLDEYRARSEREFFRNLEKIREVFEEVKSKSETDMIKEINENDNNRKKRRELETIEYKNEIIINKKNINKELKGYDTEELYIVYGRIRQLTEYDKNIRIVCISKTSWIKTYKTSYVDDFIKIKKIKINNRKASNNIIKDIIGKYCIKNNLYKCKENKIEKLFEVLEYYNSNYDIKEINKAYLYNKYGIGDYVEKRDNTIKLPYLSRKEHYEKMIEEI
jgi:hypothetical protein